MSTTSLGICGTLLFTFFKLSSCLVPGQNSQIEYEAPEVTGSQVTVGQGHPSNPIQSQQGPNIPVNYTPHIEYEAPELPQHSQGQKQLQGYGQITASGTTGQAANVNNPYLEYEAPEIPTAQHGSTVLGTTLVGGQITGTGSPAVTTNTNYEYEAPEIPTGSSNTHQNSHQRKNQTSRPRQTYSIGENMNGQRTFGNLYTNLQSSEFGQHGISGTNIYHDNSVFANDRGKVLKGIFNMFKQLVQFYNYDMNKVGAALRYNSMRFATSGKSSGNIQDLQTIGNVNPYNGDTGTRAVSNSDFISGSGTAHGQKVDQKAVQQTVGGTGSDKTLPNQTTGQIVSNQTDKVKTIAKPVLNKATLATDSGQSAINEANVTTGSRQSAVNEAHGTTDSGQSVVNQANGTTDSGQSVAKQANVASVNSQANANLSHPTVLSGNGGRAGYVPHQVTSLTVARLKAYVEKAWGKRYRN